jgi:adenylylsulfate kinase-like enzyme
MTIPVLWLTGPPGVGKTAVAWEIYRRLQRAGADPAYVDVDQLGMCFPLREDPARHTLKTRNVAALRANFTAAGARALVVSGVVDARRGPDIDTLGGRHVQVARLRADHNELRARLGRRNARLSPQRGSLVRHESAVEEAKVFDRSSFADVFVDTTGLSIDEVATRTLRDFGDWPLVESERTGSRTLDRDVRAPVGGEVLWLSGPTGIGKSTIGFRAYLDVLRSGGRAAYVDVDQIGFSSPAPRDHSLQARNLAALWSNFHDAGARLAVVVGRVFTRSDALLYEQALPRARLSWCQLHVGDAELTRRVLSRRDGGSWTQPGDPLRDRPEDELRTVADRAIAASHLLEQRNIGLPIDVAGLDVEEAAVTLLRLARWPAGEAMETQAR